MNAEQASAIRKWSTDDIAEPHRLSYWANALSTTFQEVGVSGPRTGRFTVRLETASLGEIGVSRVNASAADICRSHYVMARSVHVIYLLCSTNTAWSTTWNGKSIFLEAGDLMLVDSSSRFEFRFPAGLSCTVILELLPGWMESWMPDAAECGARRIDGRTGWGEVLSAFVRQLTPEFAVDLPLPKHMLVDQFGALLALASGRDLAGEPASERGAKALAARIQDAIRERFADPDLSAMAIAGTLNVSERTLHRALAKSGTTFGQCLAGYRMSVAERMLREPRFDHLLLAEIGRRVGLPDASHFIRQCNRHLDSTPGKLRRSR